MRTHAALGYDLLVGSGFSPEMLQVVRSHHEMLDGSGYPDGLRAPEIPDLVRLVTICDIYGALIERRPYRAPMQGGEAYDILRSMTGASGTTVGRSSTSRPTPAPAGASTAGTGRRRPTRSSGPTSGSNSACRAAAFGGRLAPATGS